MAKLFFSYSHRDEALRNELEVHLSMLKREGLVDSWHDRKITAGSDLGHEIDRNLESSQIILLLVSAHFLASDYCYERELARAMELHEEGKARVIPVILHPCDWQAAPFGKLLATPTDGKPVSMFANQDEAFAIVARDVRQALNSLGITSDTEQSQPAETTDTSSDSSAERSSNLRVRRRFDDHERDQFLEDSFEYIARYIEASLDELAARNPQISSRFRRNDATSFSAMIYDGGERVAQCNIWYGNSSFQSNAIMYSEGEHTSRNSFNESMTVEDDGYTLHLKPFGMSMLGRDRDKPLSQQGAAEYYWGMLIRPLQD